MVAPIFVCLLMCGQQVAVTVDATATPQARRDTRFEIVAGDPNVWPANPDFLAFKAAVTRALQANGFQPAAAPGQGDLVVVIDWMTGDPKVVYRHMGGDVGRPQVMGAAPGGKGGMPAGGTNNSASFGFGTDPTDRPEVSYQHTFTLKAVDKAAYAADPAAAGLWAMTLVSETPSDSPGAAAPQMLAAALPYMTQTVHRAKVVLGAKEDPVRYVRGDIPALPVKKP